MVILSWDSFGSAEFQKWAFSFSIPDVILKKQSKLFQFCENGFTYSVSEKSAKWSFSLASVKAGPN